MKSLAAPRQSRNLTSKQKISLLLHSDDPAGVAKLDDLKGSFAVEYVLEELVAKHNRHTIPSLLNLIRNHRK